MTVMSVTLKCDRDGTQAVQDPAFPITMPYGWINLSAGGNGVMPSSMHLCPACAAQLQDFLSPPGTTSALKLVPPPPTPPAG